MCLHPARVSTAWWRHTPNQSFPAALATGQRWTLVIGLRADHAKYTTAVRRVLTCQQSPRADTAPLPTGQGRTCIWTETSRSLLRALTGTQEEERSCARILWAPVSENQPVPHPGQRAPRPAGEGRSARLVDSISGETEESNGAGADLAPVRLWLVCLGGTPEGPPTRSSASPPRERLPGQRGPGL